MLILSLETTCDETGAAVLEGARHQSTRVPRILSNVVASQFDLHSRFRGVVPEIAARAHVRQILPVIDEALTQAGVTLTDLGAVAVATRPGLVGSLVVGLTAAKSLALALDIPLVEFNHLEGHLYASQVAYPDTSIYPCVGLVVSGGHTHLYVCGSPLEYDLLGGTLDDAAGEAFDKVAQLLDLGFPGGPAIERAAQSGNPKALPLPRAFFHEDRLDFSFSGLKTAVLYALRGQDARGDANNPTAARISTADVAASFQQAVVDVLVKKCAQALERTGLRKLCIGGGVAANRLLRDRLERMAASRRAELFIPPASLCTDNAALGAIAFPRLWAGLTAGLDIDVAAGLLRPGRQPGGDQLHDSPLSQPPRR